MYCASNFPYTSQYIDINIYANSLCVNYYIWAISNSREILKNDAYDLHSRELS